MTQGRVEQIASRSHPSSHRRRAHSLMSGLMCLLPIMTFVIVVYSRLQSCGSDVGPTSSFVVLFTRFTFGSRAEPCRCPKQEMAPILHRPKPPSSSPLAHNITKNGNLLQEHTYHGKRRNHHNPLQTSATSVVLQPRLPGTNFIAILT